jgi:hypothetical protein
MYDSMCYLGIIKQQFLPGVQEMLRHSVASKAAASTGGSSRGCIDQMVDLAVETSEIAQLKESTLMWLYLLVVLRHSAMIKLLFAGLVRSRERRVTISPGENLNSPLKISVNLSLSI